MNDLYVAAGGTLDPRSMAQLGAATGYRLDRPPDWFTLELGNTCNLKCRSCDPAFSSKIAADPVQRAWAEERADRPGDGVPPDNRFAERAWARDISRTADMIASGASENAVLALLGGEPFLIKQTWELLEALVERNVARNIFAGISTNGQWRSTKLEELAPAFRGFGTSVSIDGYGRLFEYLRHGGRWDTLRGTLDWLTGLDCVSVSVTPTLQNTNALNMVRLFRALDTYDLTFSYNVLTWPTRLQPANLPPAIRSLAAQRLRDYLRDDCAPYNAEVVCGYAEVLEEDPDAFDEELFHEFMTFTNDLDDSRGERLADAAPELFDLIAEAGIVWTADRRHTAMTTP
jgi:MoaA/NifB/PqqE/SkfB family radical SAM enzyme